VRQKATLPHARHRAVGRPGDRQPPRWRVIALNRDSGEIVWDKKIATVNEFAPKTLQLRPSREGKCWSRTASVRGRAAGSRPSTRARQRVWRWYAVRRRRAGSETWKDRPTPGKRGRRHVADRFLRSRRGSRSGDGQPVAGYDPRRARDNLYTNSLALDINTASSLHFQYTAERFLDYDEVRIHYLHDVHNQRRESQGGESFRRTAFSIPRPRQRQLIKGSQYVTAELDQGLRPGRLAALGVNRARRAENVTEARRLRTIPLKRTCRALDFGGVRVYSADRVTIPVSRHFALRSWGRTGWAT